MIWHFIVNIQRAESLIYIPKRDVSIIQFFHMLGGSPLNSPTCVPFKGPIQSCLDKLTSKFNNLTDYTYSKISLNALRSATNCFVLCP